MPEGVNLGSAYGTIQIDLSKLKTDLQAGGAELRNFERTADTSATQSARSFDKLKESATKVGLGLAGIAAAGLALIRSVAMTAARTQVLGTVLHQVGKNAGYSTAMLDATVNTIKKLGITTQEARTAVVSFIQAELDVAKAATLARVAQDLAVIAGQNSSQAFATLTQAIVSQETMLLRQYGIVKGLVEIYGDYAKAHGVVASALDETQKKQAFLDAILSAGAKAAGSYEAAMGDVGKQLTSLPRYFEEAKNALGVFYQGILGFGVKGLTALLKEFTDLEPGAQGAIAAILGCVTVFASLGSMALLLVPKLIAAKNALLAMNAASSGMLGIVGLAALVITAIVAVAAAVSANQAAHRKESAELASSSTSYSVYRTKLDEAGSAAYGLSEALYNLVQAQEESKRAGFAEALLKAQASLKGLAQDAANFGQGTTTMVKAANAAQLAVLQDRQAVLELGTSLGMTGQVLIDYTANTLALADAEARRRIYAANEARFERDRVGILNNLMAAESDVTEVVSDHGAAMQQLAKDYMAANQAAVDLAKETGLSVDEVKRLRDQLGYTDEEIKGFADNLEITGGELDALAKSTGLSKDQIRILNEQFGLGEQEIQDYAQALRNAEQAQRDLIGAFADAMTAFGELDPKSEDYKKKLADITLELSLQIAEQKGLLQEWASERFEGPQIEYFSDAANVFEAIKAGLIPVDEGLGRLINQTLPGLGTALGNAKTTAQDNQLTVDDIISGDFEVKLQARLAELSTAFVVPVPTGDDVAESLSDAWAAGWKALPEPTAEGADLLVKAMGLDTLERTAATAFTGVQTSFATTTTGMQTEATALATNVKAAITSIPLDATPQFKALSTGWTTIIDAMSLKALAFRDNVIAMLKGIVDFVNTMSVSATISWSATGAPGFAAGGVVPGAAGAPMAATVHGGELILNPGQQAQLARMFGTSVRDLARSALAGGSAGGRAGTTYQTQFEQHFGDVVVRNREEAQQFGLDTSYGAMYRLRAVGLIR